MPLSFESSSSRVVDWSLALGGACCLAVGLFVFVKSEQPVMHRSIILLISICLLALGTSHLVEAHSPVLAARLKFVARMFAGFALFSVSWTLSHP